MNDSIVKIDDVMFKLQEDHNFDWLAKLGRVFEVFAQQDSGNISFGVEKNRERFFIKYAGAKSTAFSGDPQDAIKNLKNAMSLYKDLSHPSLIKLVDHYEVGLGYAAVFEWFDGESLHPHWSFPPPAKYNDPNSPFYRYKHLSVPQRLISLDRIYSFHEFVEKKGFIAIDFYDGSLLYDFSKNETKISILIFIKKDHITIQWGDYGAPPDLCPQKNFLSVQR